MEKAVCPKQTWIEKVVPLVVSIFPCCKYIDYSTNINYMKRGDGPWDKIKKECVEFILSVLKVRSYNCYFKISWVDCKSNSCVMVHEKAALSIVAVIYDEMWHNLRDSKWNIYGSSSKILRLSLTKNKYNKAQILHFTYM